MQPTKEDGDCAQILRRRLQIYISEGPSLNLWLGITSSFMTPSIMQSLSSMACTGILKRNYKK